MRTLFNSISEVIPCFTLLSPSLVKDIYFLKALIEKPVNNRFSDRYRQGGYIKRLEADPWGNDYQYERPGKNNTFDIISLGADGQKGGDGLDSDISNWD